MKLASTRMAVIVALVVLECCLFFAAFSDSHLDKPGSSSAWYEWRQHPSPKSGAAWLAERRKIRIEQAAVDAVIWSLIIATGAGVYYVGRGHKRQV